MLPTDAAKRKQYPIATGFMDYFPDAIAAIAHLSWKATEQHHPGQPVHWDRSKSSDEADTMMRHFLQRGTIDSDGIPHSVKMAWRALAIVQKELEQKSESESLPKRSLQTEEPAPGTCCRPERPRSDDNLILAPGTLRR